MALATLIAITLGCIGWSLWIRRVTWSCRWEVAATLNIALQGLAVILMSPFASETLGHWLHALTGMWNLEDYIGHDAYIVAASAVVYNALGRLADDHAMQMTFKQYVERPATLCIPLLLVTFSIGNGARVYRSDFFEVPTDFWLALYWLLLCGTADLPAGLRCAGPADPAQGSAFAAHRQRLPRRIGQRHPRLHCADPHRLRAAAAGDRGRHAGVDLRLRVWRRIRVDVGPVLAHQDQVVHPRQSLTRCLAGSAGVRR